jgi:cytochrome c biogenesis protein CcdA
MLIWCMTLFGLGVLAFLDTIFNYGEIFRRVNSILFMLLSLGLLIRTRMLIKFGRIEALVKRNTELETRLNDTADNTATPEMEPEKVY